MASVDQVADAMVDAVIAALSISNGETVWYDGAYTFIPNPPNQVGVGEPYGQAMSQILGQNEAQVTVHPLTAAAQNRTSRKPKWKPATIQPVTIAAAVAGISGGYMITLSDVTVASVSGPQPGLNIHAFCGGPRFDGYYPLVADDTLDTAATALAAAITAVAIAAGQPGVTASAIGNVITVLGTPYCTVKIGGQVTFVAEARRTMLPMQVSIWTPQAKYRDAMSKQIENNVGLATTPFQQAHDNAAIWVRLRGAPRWAGISQHSYSLYEAHFIFECEYPTFITSTGAVVEGMGITFIDETDNITINEAAS